jgi:N-dimethylarginine dimethylaminohydrolase
MTNSNDIFTTAAYGGEGWSPRKTSAPVDVGRARAHHDLLADAYRQAGVAVRYVEPDQVSPPNLMFVADLMFMTPEGAILGRPASTVRAGEERLVARRLAELGVPILRVVRGNGTFEGADAAWLTPETVLVARGLRTNSEGADQVAGTLGEMGIEVILVDLPPGTMHLMGSSVLPIRTWRLAGPTDYPRQPLKPYKPTGTRWSTCATRPRSSKAWHLTL